MIALPYSASWWCAPQEGDVVRAEYCDCQCREGAPKRRARQADEIKSDRDAASSRKKVSTISQQLDPISV
jgi:hypothetical protein